MSIEDEEGTEETTEEELSEEEVALRQEQDFLAGFDRTAEEAEVSTPYQEAEPAPAEEEPPEEETEPDGQLTSALETIEKLNKKVASLEGKQGNVKQLIDQGVAAALETMRPADAPTAEEFEAAQDDPEALEALMEDYPAFAPLGQAVKSLNAKMSKLDQVIDQRISATEAQRQSHEARRAEMEEVAALNEAHPGWYETVHGDQFKGFALDGGPPKSAYDHVVAISQEANRNGQSSEEADIIVTGWARDFPDWWQDRGRLLFGNAKESVEILDRYEARNAAGDEPDQKKDEVEDLRQKRLRSTVVVDGRSGVSTTGLNDDEAFSAGFDKVKKQRVGGLQGGQFSQDA